jgi:glutaredoxin-related protein
MEIFHRVIVDDIWCAVERDDVVVLGMAWNPYCTSVLNALTQADIPYTYLRYGNYLFGWKKRLAIKLWSGWPTYPQVFVNGTLIGGNQDVRAALADGSLRELLGANG